MAFTSVCAQEALGPGEAVLFEAASEPIAIFNLAGEFYAIEDTCTHGDWSLAEGYIEGDTVECSLHQGKFCIKTGAAVQIPAVQAVMTFPVRVIDGFVHVDPEAGSLSTE